ncbi:hypothetical protein [Idiomarina sp.]|uniref:hypothetical protein n=1 Tax=Idiomarina sp. TaxID=1874361 RepID=UPI0025BF694D|nr:hypothetical protein [Idiomarina sp.]
MDNHQTKLNGSSLGFFLTTGMMYLALALLAVSPVAVIWIAADWLHEVFRQSNTFFGQNPRLYTVLTIIAVSAALTLVADKIYHHIKAQQKRQLEHI